MRPTPDRWSKSEPPSLWLSSGSPVSINEEPYQRGLRGHVAERLRYGYKAQRSLPLEEGRRLFPIGIGGSHDLHDLTWLERKPYDYHSGWKLPLHR